jgi:hypothetical protein
MASAPDDYVFGSSRVSSLCRIGIADRHAIETGALLFGMAWLQAVVASAFFFLAFSLLEFLALVSAAGAFDLRSLFVCDVEVC